MTQEQMVEQLRRLLSDEQVLAGAATERAYDCDAYTVDRSKPSCVVLPSTTDEVASIVRWCIANQVPFTGRGAGTGLSGGAMPAVGGVVISTKKMTSILEIDLANQCLKAQTGVVNTKITAAVREQNLHFAPDPSSQTVSTLGGNIAENAGGPHTLKYGVTVQHVLAVTLVTPEGEIVTLGSKVSGGPGYDFVGLMVGSEGTLGIVTEAWVRLTPIPKVVQTALISFDSVRAATQSVADIIATGTIPAALEMMDKGILAACKAAFGLEYPEGTLALLLIECDGDDLAQVTHEMANVNRVCSNNGAIKIEMAKDEADRQRLWTARKKGVGAMGRLAPSIVTHDGVIPRSKLPEMLDFVYEVANRHGVGVANLFHAGDGNLHPCFYFDDRNPAEISAVVAAGEEIIRRCVEFGGSVTGEHGVGVEKADLLTLMFDEPSLDFQRKARSIFNSNALCNPCKILPNEKGCTEHKRRWRGIAW